MTQIDDAKTLMSAHDHSPVDAEHRDFRPVSRPPPGYAMPVQGENTATRPRPLQPPLGRARRTLHVACAAGLVLALSFSGLVRAVHADDPTVVSSPQAHPLAGHLAEVYRADLDGIIERRYLRVLTSHGAFDYFLADGKPRGFQYEMVKAFVARLNKRHPAPRGQPPIEFDIIPVADGEMIPMLVAGRGDLVAARLTRTAGRDASVAFSRPYHTVDEVVVQHRDGPAIEALDDLSGHSVSVRRSSSYYESLVDENARLGASGHAPIRIHTVDDALTTERILSLVSEGALERTIADSLVAEAVAAHHTELQVLSSVRLREGGRLAWAVPIGSKALLAEVDAFLPRYVEGSLHGNLAVKEYFGRLQPVQRALASGDAVSISPYDDVFKEFAARYGLDWRLLAAIAWQESRFDQRATNRSGATGVFQIKPVTAAEPYVGITDVKGAANARNNIHAGIKYLAWIKARYFDPVSEMHEKDRIRMTLAAYNAGPRNVSRARKKAAEMGLDPNRWFRNVELAMLALRKREPVRYVSQINQSYVAYLLLGYE